MEQGGISIIPPTGITENSVRKSKSIGITLRSNSSIQSAKEKLKSPWLQNLTREDATLLDTVVLGLGEIIGTAILVFLGCLGCVGSMGSTPPIMQISLTFGFAVMIAIQAVGHISGAHINPSITLAALILGKMSLPMAGLYFIAQCAGGLIGYGLLKVITPDGMLYAGNPESAGSFCTTDLHASLTTMQGFVAEILATGLLTLFACGIWDSRNEKNTDSIPIKFSLVVAALCFAFAPYTGCSLNPARSLAPAVWNGYWAHHWIYWLGPFVGAILASVFYRCVFSVKSEAQEQPQDANLTGVQS